MVWQSDADTPELPSTLQEGPEDCLEDHAFLKVHLRSCAKSFARKKKGRTSEFLPSMSWEVQEDRPCFQRYWLAGVSKIQKFKKSQLLGVQCWQDICREAGLYTGCARCRMVRALLLLAARCFTKRPTEKTAIVDAFLHAGFDGMRCQ